MNIKKIGIILSAFLFLLILPSQNLRAQGHFEFGFHYSRWSIDILRGWIEDSLSDELEEDLKDEILDELREDYPSLRDISYSQSVSFDSEGDNKCFR